MFQLKQVACAYEQKKVFTGLDLEIRQGQYVMLMGENGTGKSSLISLLTGFKQEESGRILFLRKDLKEWLKDKRQKRDFLWFLLDIPSFRHIRVISQLLCFGQEVESLPLFLELAGFRCHIRPLKLRQQTDVLHQDFLF